MGNITEIRKGDRFKCIVTSGVNGEVAFQVNGIYESKSDGTIEDKDGKTVLWGTKPDGTWSDANEVFIKLTSNEEMIEAIKAIIRKHGEFDIYDVETDERPLIFDGFVITVFANDFTEKFVGVSTFVPYYDEPLYESTLKWSELKEETLVQIFTLARQWENQQD